MLKKPKLLLLSFFAVLSLATTVLIPLSVIAQERTIKEDPCPQGYIELSVALQDGSNCILESNQTTPLENNSIIVYLRNIIRFLSAGVGLVIILMITVSGVQYISSQGDPQATASAKGRLANSIIALFLFIFMFAILNFLIPGRIIG